MKTCSKCGEVKPLSEFHSDKSKRIGVRSDCKSCVSSYRNQPDVVARSNASGRRAWNKMSKERQRQNNRKTLLRGYGINQEIFDEMLKQQGGSCAICGTEDSGSKSWSIDHDHACCEDKRNACGNCVRGLLCTNCNTAIGKFKDDPDLLLAAAAYLISQSRIPTTTGGK